MVKDVKVIKEEIISVIKRRGPSLPIQIAGDIKMNTLFTSAFLSELVSDKKINISDMRVGSSPIYFLQEQEPLLEKFSQHLKSKEKEAFLLLKEKKFLKDLEQEPAIRVALRAIKDFAIPFQKNNEPVWRYFIISEKEFEEEKKIKEIEKIIQPIIKQEIEPTISDIKFEKKETKKRKIKKSTNKPQNDKFFNKLKETLSKKSIEIIDLLDFSKSHIDLKVKAKETEMFLTAYNKKKITEEDIVKTYKKACELNLKYIILSLGESPKKINNLINSIKSLEIIEKIEG